MTVLAPGSGTAAPPGPMAAVSCEVELMPGWLQVLTRFNPLSYEIDALRGLLIGTPANMAVDVTVLVAVTIAGISAAAALLPRLAKG